MKTRDLKNTCAGVYDVLVVGGGVHGATMAYHAAKAGYRTVLVEKNDFCSATSANSLKILHGGLRYLQHLNIKRMRHSICARREMMQLAPYLVEPLPCMMPLYGSGLLGRGALRAALFVNDCIGWDRNRGLAEEHRLPGGHIASKEKCLKVIPDITMEELDGALVWYDALAVNTERLVLEYILESFSYGAAAVNYAAVTAVEKDGDFYQVSVADGLSQDVYQLKTRYIINAAGPWFEKSLGGQVQPAATKQQWALALNIVSKKKLFADYAVALEGKSTYEDKDAIVKRGKRLYFLVPWHGYTMIGTDYEQSSADPDNLRVQRETIQNMVDDINAIYPPAELSYEDITFYQAGLLPMRNETEQGDIQLEKNSTFHGHQDIGFERVLSVKGVKYTTAPHVAHEIVHYLQRYCQSVEKSEQVKQSFANSGNRNVELLKQKGMLEKRYGRRVAQILSLERIGREDDIWLDESAQLLRAEILYLLQEEMVCKLSDIVFRRTGLGTAECPELKLLTKLSAFMGEILGWDETRQQQEVKEVLLRYVPLCSVDEPGFVLYK